ncbi:sodium/proton antiporter (NhaC family) [Salsuginibacillus halophilus]|uniref:Sodium/proton antiporter (NhaC family) n=1 Tax=Salsuginibacillus halophilus TaxID=517424 RepID=A0A2P8H882_9BACI|nr:Na+/H+ antiporter NhaC family protein [Salsuginibacillus halophilus]PSL42436.1 sodium/proton antiporter (NhaC family) [Salsuginibacillus halophilus]
MEEPNFWSVIPPLIALGLILLTRRVLLSLGAGIIAAAFIVHDGNPAAAISDIALTITGFFYTDGALNTWELYILLFLFMLGIMTALITYTGGSRAFGEWALRRVKTRAGAQAATLLFGIIVFIDDYFNSLTVGQVSRPATDRFRVSRAKLAYIVDSAAAPICVLAPLSSWGAYIITIIAGILADEGITAYSGFEAFIYMIPMNFYALTAILFAFLVIVWRVNIGPMKTHETRALNTGELLNPARGAVPGGGQTEAVHTGRVRDLVVPIIVLIGSTVFFMLWTGAQAAGSGAGILDMFADTDVATSLLYGGAIGVLTAVGLTLTYKPAGRELARTTGAGIQSMLPAVYILLFAWTIAAFIDALGTGEYLAGVVDGAIAPMWLPAVLFVVAGFMAFSTGTSWGSFGLLLPIAGEMAAVIDPSMMLVMLASVLAGSIFGDHCSPISDTTILSSTGAGSHHIDHVLTQLPYALIVAATSIAGFILTGATGSTAIGLTASLGLAIVIAWLLRGTRES